MEFIEFYLTDYSFVFDTNFSLACMIILIGRTIQGYSGFGGAIIIIPALAILFNPITALSMTMFMSFFSNIIVLPEATKKANYSEVLPVIIGNTATISLGISFFLAAEPSLIRQDMGFAILIIALILLSGWTYKGKRNFFVGVSFGSFSGIILRSFGVPAGPFTAIYYMSSPAIPEIKRANITLTFGVAVFVVMATLIISKSFSEKILLLSIFTLPFALIGTWTGKYIFKVLPTTWYKKATFFILFLTGITILLKG